MSADADAVAENLAVCYREIYKKTMRDVPICNDALAVEAIGFRNFANCVVGAIITPWFLNLVVVAQDRCGVAPARLRFPAGEVDLNVSELEGFGRLSSCSLFSPMSDFLDQAAARKAAEAALDALSNPHLHEAGSERPAASVGVNRRALLGGRRREPGREAAL